MKSFRHRIAVWGAFVVATFAMLLDAAGAEYRLDFSVSAKDTPSALEARELEEGVVRETRIDGAKTPRVQEALGPGDVLTVSLFPGKEVRLTLAERTPSLPGNETFLATADGYGDTLNAVVVRTGDGFQIDIQDFLSCKVYSVYTGKDGTVVKEIEHLDKEIIDLKPLEAPVPEGFVESKKDLTPEDDVEALPSGSIANVDIMVVYTTSASRWVASNGGARNFAEVAVQKMNTAIANTGLESDFRFRLVGVEEVAGNSSDLSSLLTSVKGGYTLGGYNWSQVGTLRDSYGADIVTVLTDTGSAYGTTGIGYALQSYNSSYFASSAYNACSIMAVAQGHTLTHEVGHNMGAGHSDAQASDPGPQYYSYSSGYYFYVGSTGYHTIMAYNSDGYGSFYESAPYFSSPDYSYQGVRVGNSTHDNTRTLRNNFQRVSGFRSETVPAGVPNDNFSSATTISGASGSTSGSNEDATHESNDPSYLGTYTVWWKWTAPQSGTVTFNTNGSDFDTKLGAYTGSSLSSLSAKATDDDSGDGNASLVSFQAVSGTTYYIGVSGYGSSYGSIRLSWSLVPLAPANDNFSSATTISGASGSTSGSNEDATHESNDPSYLGTYTVWWKWTAPQSGTVTFNTNGSDFDTKLGAYTGSSLSSLSAKATDDDSGDGTASLVSFQAVSGTTYYIGVSGYGSSYGSIRLAWSLSVPQPSTPSAPSSVSAADGSSTANVTITWGTVSGATSYTLYRGTTSTPTTALASGLASASYTDTSATPGTLYYYRVKAVNSAGSSGYSASDSGYRKLTAPTISTATGSSSGVALSWGAVTGASYYRVFRATSSSGTKTALGSWQTGTSYTDTSGTAGTTYYYFVQAAVDSSGTRPSAYSASKTGAKTQGAPANDNFAAASTISGVSGSTTGSNINATHQSNDPSHLGTCTVWWKWTAPVSGLVTFRTDGSDFDTMLGAYTGLTLANSSEITYNDDYNGYESRISFRAVAGTTYRICVSGYSGYSGSIALSWSCSSSPALDFNGDGRSDFVLFDPADRMWKLQYLDNYDDGGWYSSVVYLSSTVPAPADFDGDGVTDRAVYYKPTGTWYILQSSTGNVVTKQYGWSATCPLPADYDGDGRADLCVYDKPHGDWYFTFSSTNVRTIKNFGWNGCIPVQGDFDGDGRADLAVYCMARGAYEGHWFIASSANGGRVTEKAWGWSGTVPAPADYDGDGKTDICVFYRPTGTWYILYSGGGSRTIQYGWSTVTPVPADYDGDGRDDVALYDSRDGYWYVNYSSGGNDRFWGYDYCHPVLPQTTVYRWFGL